MHFPILRLVIVSHRGLIGVETESGMGGFWPFKATEVAEKRRRVPFEYREIEADSCTRKAG